LVAVGECTTLAGRRAPGRELMIAVVARTIAEPVSDTSEL